MNKRPLRKTVYFMETGQEYLLAYIMAFTYGGVILGYWVFPFMVLFHLLLSSAKKKDPEFLKVFIRGIKVKWLEGDRFPVDLLAPPQTESEPIVLPAGKRKSTTILTLISSIKAKKPPLSDIALLKGEEK